MKRRGFTIFEVTVAIVLLSALTALCLEFFAGVTGQQKDQNAELAATQEAANVMERLAAVAWDDLSKQPGGRFELSPQARKMLPDGRVEVNVSGTLRVPLEGGTRSVPDTIARRVAVAVCWRPLPGGPERKARVVAWRYKP
jgi:prepilin-type N-terminal cleavage/methylation domain-containing protein